MALHQGVDHRTRAIAVVVHLEVLILLLQAEAIVIPAEVRGVQVSHLVAAGLQVLVTQDLARLDQDHLDHLDHQDPDGNS